MSASPQELEYYRRIEDFFATMRGVPHCLSPKDVLLLRTWWSEQVPYSAVVAGVTEVFDRRTAEGADDPVVSLSYCRHAVKRNAKRLAEARVGGTDPARGQTCEAEQGRAEPGVLAQLEALARLLGRAADRAEAELPAVARVIRSFVDHVEMTASMPEDVVEEHLFSLEIALLESCRRALGDEVAEAMAAQARQAAQAAGASGGELSRQARAWLDREVRERLRLPRLELSD
jgi:hypothetical protein